MRHVDRKLVATPQSLTIGGAGDEELLKARSFYKALLKPTKKVTRNAKLNGKREPKTYGFSAYKRDDVKYALEKLFHGKCAYCETRYDSSAPVDVEHYRPKGAVAEQKDHGGYWWVAMAWENLLPSCIDCNRLRGQVIVQPSDSLEELAASTKPVLSNRGKKDSFPLAEGCARAVAEVTDFKDELPLLLNPCEDDPSQSLGFSLSNHKPSALMHPSGHGHAKLRGSVSIKIYGLNRLKLVQDRTRLLRHLEFLGELIIDLSVSIDELETPAASLALAALPARNVVQRLRLLRDRTYTEIGMLTADDAPYSTMAKVWLSGFKSRLAAANP